MLDTLKLKVMKSNMIKTAGAALLLTALTSCGTYIQGGGGYTGYDDSYYGGYGSGSLLSYSQARDQALYLSDKMAYELGLNAAQYDAVYEINFDYLTNMHQYNDLYGNYWARRNSDLRYVLSPSQYNYYVGAGYFYRPLGYQNNTVVYNIYNRYSNPEYYYYVRPTNYASYKGGHNRSTTSYYSNRKFGGRKSIRRNDTFGQSNTAGNMRTGTTTSRGTNRTFGGRVSTNQNSTNTNTRKNGTFGKSQRDTGSQRGTTNFGTSNRQQTTRNTTTTQQQTTTGGGNRSFGGRPNNTSTQQRTTVAPRQSTPSTTTSQPSTTTSTTTRSGGHR